MKKKCVAFRDSVDVQEISVFELHHFEELKVTYYAKFTLALFSYDNTWLQPVAAIFRKCLLKQSVQETAPL